MLTGSIPAIITPFSNGGVDYDSFEKLLNWQIKSGISGVTVCGTTGESPTLSHDEHMKLVEFAIKVASKKIPVIAGTGSNSTKEAIEFTKHAYKAGANYGLVVTPYYNKPTQEGLYQHYKSINDNCGIPIIIYNIPSRSVIDMSVETMARLYELKNVVGVKDATGDLNRVDQQKEKMGNDFIQLTGNDDNAFEFNKRGGVGTISVTANVAPKLCSEFQKLSKSSNEDDLKKAQQLDDMLQPLHKNLFIESNPSPVKYAAKLLGLCDDAVRLPLVKITENTKKEVEKALKVAKLIDE